MTRVCAVRCNKVCRSVCWDAKNRYSLPDPDTTTLAAASDDGKAQKQAISIQTRQRLPRRPGQHMLSANTERLKPFQRCHSFSARTQQSFSGATIQTEDSTIASLRARSSPSPQTKYRRQRPRTVSSGTATHTVFPLSAPAHGCCPSPEPHNPPSASSR